MKFPLRAPASLLLVLTALLPTPACARQSSPAQQGGHTPGQDIPVDGGSAQLDAAESNPAGPDQVEPEQAGSPVPAEQVAASRNLLVILVDDLRPTLGCMGDELARTPHIDALASRGLVFDRHYCQQALCNPSRSSMLTGLRPRTIGVTTLAQDYREERPEVRTWPQVLRGSGYTTLALGKVHHLPHLSDPLSWSDAPWWPERDHYHTEEGREALAERQRWFAEEGIERKARGLPFEAPEVEGTQLMDGKLATRAIERLEELAAAGRPFALTVGFLKPHLPFVAPADCWERHEPGAGAGDLPGELPAGAPDFAGVGLGELRAYVGIPEDGPLEPELASSLRQGYRACVSHVDDQVGRLLAALERLGLDDATAVVLWSDHGFQLGELGQWCKQTNLETAVRSPLIVSVPDSFGEGLLRGRRTTALVESVDLYPTLLELCKVPAPGGLEGTSLLPLLRDPDRPWKRAVFSEYPRAYGKLGRRGVGLSVRTEQHRLTVWRSGKDEVGAELYGYGESLVESTSLLSAPGQEELLARMRALLNGGWRAARRGIGQD